MTSNNGTKPFNPADHLSNIKGKQYLEVKYRVQWLHELHPQAQISTELVEHVRVLDDKTSKPHKVLTYAVIKATVILPARTRSGELALYRTFTGYGSEESGDFGDYLEKAETKAVGRALAFAGLGTQFVDDLDMIKDDGTVQVVDSPVEPRPELKGWG